ncbi:hypothetical protein Hdeb2414_s0015g00446851 [Helianthus debilis subsp. tardiflorus]
MRLLATPNRIFGEWVLVAAGMSDKWSEHNTEVPVLMFNGEGVLRDLGLDPEERPKKALAKKKTKKVTVDTGATSKKGGSSRATVAAFEKGTLRFRQSNLEDYVITSDSLEGLSRIGERKKSSAAGSQSSRSAGSSAPEASMTSSSVPEEEEEEVEEEEAVKLVTRKRSREKTAVGAEPAQKTVVGPVIGKQSRLRSLYKFSPEALKKNTENVKDPEPERPKEPTPKKTKFVIIPPKPIHKEAERTVEEPAGNVIPEKEKAKETETAATTVKDKVQGLEVVHITGLDQPLKRKESEVVKPTKPAQHDAPTQTVQMASVAGGSTATVPEQTVHKDISVAAAGADAGGSGVGGQKGDGKNTSRPRSPIGADDTLGDIYYKSYTEERGEAPHQPIWGFKQDTFVEFGACRDWFLGSFPPREVNWQRVRNHESLYRTYVIGEGNALSANHQIVREWCTMYKERADWEKYWERLVKQVHGAVEN